MNTQRQRDHVDEILEQWARERPDLDITPMGVLGRLQRCSVLAEPLLRRGYQHHNIEMWEFDVLSALRRAGEPFKLTPTQLIPMLMITSGTVTHRLKLMEQRGLITRESNPQDARSMLVCITPEGKNCIDRAVESHVENEKNLLSSLTAEQVAQLDVSLSALMQALTKMTKS